MKADLKKFLEEKYRQYNHPSFITDDPINIPHRFTTKQDIEIAAFFASILAWGTRKGIINSCNKLLKGMNNLPYDFIMNTDLDKKKAFEPFAGFVHRTFNSLTFGIYLIFFSIITKTKKAWKLLSANGCKPADNNIEKALIGFHNYVFGYSEEAKEEKHCRKHISTPEKKSACKRLNMFLRWMVRNDNSGVDFGIWQNIKPSQLICPLDVHVSRVARRFNLLQRKQDDWLAATELTDYLKTLDANDPVKYDYALFGLGVIEKY